MYILVTGGLGFIGSHTCVSLLHAGITPVVLDNLYNSEKTIIEKIKKITGKEIIFFEGDILDNDIYEKIFTQFSIQAIIHFAAFKAVGESVLNPLKYYKNNVSGLINLLENAKKFNCKNIVFSSSCTVYGQPKSIEVTENTPLQAPSSPYGASKQIGEQILIDTQFFNVQCLRYFNPIGAHPSGIIGEFPKDVPSNLIPFLTQSVAGKRGPLIVHGNTYNTHDGTCIRDYVHVMDLAEVHVICALRLINSAYQNRFEIFNVGVGIGNSVLEVINTFEQINGVKVNYEIGPKREGDIEAIYANTSKINSILNWHAKYSIADCVKDAWNFQTQLG